jgi:hypothetical protein
MSTKTATKRKPQARPAPELGLYRFEERILREEAEREAALREQLQAESPLPAPYGFRPRPRLGWIERLRRWWRRLWGR